MQLLMENLRRNMIWLVVSNMFYFSILYGMSSFPFDELIFFKMGRYTTNQIVTLGRPQNTPWQNLENGYRQHEDGAFAVKALPGINGYKWSN